MVEKRLLLMKLILMSIMMLQFAMGTLHRVGGKLGWNPNVNYSQWSIQEQFYVGDWLIFNFDKRYFNVLEVNKTSYEACNDRSFIRNITRGGRDVTELTEARSYYFLSSGGYCFHGMKVVVNVEIPEEAPAPAPPSAKNGSPPNAGCNMGLLIVIAITMAYLVLLFGII